jgi:hypothetical protein
MLYLVNFQIDDYDQYSSFVIRAGSPREALKIIAKSYGNGRYYSGVRWKLGYTITEISPDGPAEGICASFHAG